MACCIGSGCGADIASLGVANNNQSLFMAVVHSPLIYGQSFDAELLIHGNLRLYSRNQVKCMVNDFLIKLPDGISSPLQCLSVSIQGFLYHMFRHIGQHGIQSYADWGIGFLYFFN